MAATAAPSESGLRESPALARAREVLGETVTLPLEVVLDAIGAIEGASQFLFNLACYGDKMREAVFGKLPEVLDASDIHALHEALEQTVQNASAALNLCLLEGIDEDDDTYDDDPRVQACDEAAFAAEHGWKERIREQFAPELESAKLIDELVLTMNRIRS